MPALQMSRTKPRSHSLGLMRLDSTRAQHSTGKMESAADDSRRTRFQDLTRALASDVRLKTAAALASSLSSALARQQQSVKQSQNTCRTSLWLQAPGILVCSLVQLLDVVSLSLLSLLQLDLSLLGQHLRQLEDLHRSCVRLLAGGARKPRAGLCRRTLTLPWHRPSCLLSFSGRSLQASCRSTSAPALYCSAASRRSCQLRQTRCTAAKSRQTCLRPGSHRSLQPARPCCQTLKRRRPSRLRPCQTEVIRAAAGRCCTGQPQVSLLVCALLCVSVLVIWSCCAARWMQPKALGQGLHQHACGPVAQCCWPAKLSCAPRPQGACTGSTGSRSDSQVPWSQRCSSAWP